jgi:hypothetical protein
MKVIKRQVELHVAMLIHQVVEKKELDIALECLE